MAYDEALAERIRQALPADDGIGEKKMFGGLCFLLNGNMGCGIVGDRLMVRVGKEQHDEAMSLPHAKPMDFTGRPMKGMVYVDPDGFSSEEDLQMWVNKGFDYARSLPAK